jgi:hypothetical protein
MDEESQQWDEEVHDEHDDFAEQDEHAEDGDGDVEGCCAIRVLVGWTGHAQDISSVWL